MADKIINQYENYATQTIWNMLTPGQREHFLHDHDLSTETEKMPVNVTFAELPQNVKEAFANHVAHGQYRYGGLLTNKDYGTGGSKYLVKFKTHSGDFKVKTIFDHSSTAAKEQIKHSYPGCSIISVQKIMRTGGPVNNEDDIAVIKVTTKNDKTFLVNAERTIDGWKLTKASGNPWAVNQKYATHVYPDLNNAIELLSQEYGKAEIDTEGEYFNNGGGIKSAADKVRGMTDEQVISELSTIFHYDMEDSGEDEDSIASNMELARQKLIEHYAETDDTDNIGERIQTLISKITADPNYDSTEEENSIFEELKTKHGWDWEEDEEAHPYFLKATDIERLQYILDNANTIFDSHTPTPSAVDDLLLNDTIAAERKKLLEEFYDRALSSSESESFESFEEFVESNKLNAPHIMDMIVRGYDKNKFVNSVLAFENTGLHEKRDNSYVKAVIENEGILYAITDYFSSSDIKDEKLSNLWGTASEKIKQLEDSLSKTEFAPGLLILNDKNEYLVIIDPPYKEVPISELPEKYHSLVNEIKTDISNIQDMLSKFKNGGQMDKKNNHERYKVNTLWKIPVEKGTGKIGSPISIMTGTKAEISNYLKKHKSELYDGWSGIEEWPASATAEEVARYNQQNLKNGGQMETTETVSSYLRGLNQSAFPENLQTYINDTLLTDSDIDLIPIEDPKIVMLQKLIGDKYLSALQSTATAQGEMSRQDLIDAIEGLKLIADEDPDAADAIAGLELLLEDMPEKKNDGGGVDEYTDLFEDYDNQPKKLQKIVEKWSETAIDEGFDYDDLAKFQKEVESIGYTFDYGLDAEPYGLRPVGVELKELKGFETFRKGGPITKPAEGTVRKESEINKIWKSIHNKVKNYNVKKIVDEWNDNFTNKITEAQVKNNPDYYRNYLDLGLREQVLNEAEYKKYFKNGGSISKPVSTFTYYPFQKRKNWKVGDKVVVRVVDKWEPDTVKEVLKGKDRGLFILTNNPYQYHWSELLPAKFANGGLMCPHGTKIQTILIDKEKFSKDEAKKWIKDHKKISGKMDETENKYRFRQQDPDKFIEDTFATIQFTDGVQGVIACPKK